MFFWGFMCGDFKGFLIEVAWVGGVFAEPF